MSNYLWSARNNAFFPIGMLEKYDSQGWDITDVTEIDDAVASEFMAQPPAGKVRISGKDGSPEWADIPPPTREEMLATVEAERQRLLAHADAVTADWRTELMLEEISDNDRAKLSAWMAYKRSVKAVRGEDALESDFAWPEQPS